MRMASDKILVFLSWSKDNIDMRTEVDMTMKLEFTSFRVTKVLWTSRDRGEIDRHRLRKANM